MVRYESNRIVYATLFKLAPPESWQPLRLNVRFCPFFTLFTFKLETGDI